MRGLGLMWANLEGLLIKEYVNEGTAVKAMRSVMKLARNKGCEIVGLGFPFKHSEISTSDTTL